MIPCHRGADMPPIRIPSTRASTRSASELTAIGLMSPESSSDLQSQRSLFSLEPEHRNTPGGTLPCRWRSPKCRVIRPRRICRHRDNFRYGLGHGNWICACINSEAGPRPAVGCLDGRRHRDDLLGQGVRRHHGPCGAPGCTASRQSRRRAGGPHAGPAGTDSAGHPELGP